MTTTNTQTVTAEDTRAAERRHRRQLSEGARAERRLGWLLIPPPAIVMISVAAAFSWQYGWTPHMGSLVNSSAPLTKTFSAIAIIILAEVWKTPPFMALLLMAGLSLVPEDLQKAAKVDGATAWQRFVRITLPLMAPAILVALLFRTLDAFRIFDNIFILTPGGNGTYSVSLLGSANLFTALNLGIGSAISVLIFICVAIIAFVFIRLFGAAVPGSAQGRR